MSKVDTEWFNHKKAKITKFVSCDQVQKELDELEKRLQTQIDALLSQISGYQIILGALTIPTSLQELLTWAGKVIDALTFFAKPYLNAIQTEIELIQKYIELVNELQTKIGTLQCNIEVGSLPEVPTP